MRRFVFLILMILGTAYADTIDHYMTIVRNIPQMEMKADPQAQAWARSARTILTLTSESIAETLTLVNESAKRQGNPLFCPPSSFQLSALIVHDLIQQTYRELSSQQSDKDKMTVSQVALLGLSKQYPCTSSASPNKQMASVSAWGH